jgi:hypothetical protein
MLRSVLATSLRMMRVCHCMRCEAASVEVVEEVPDPMKLKITGLTGGHKDSIWV